jgi:hypothetical protein
LDGIHSLQRERLQAQVWPQVTRRRQRLRRHVGAARVRDTTRMRLTQEEDAQGPIDQEEIFQPRPLVLAALTPVLCSRVLGARAGSLGAIMTTRGAAGAVVAGTSAAGGASSGRGGTAPPRRAPGLHTATGRVPQATQGVAHHGQ